MRWPNCHVGNVRQVPIGDQEVVNPELKVPEAEPPGEAAEETPAPQATTSKATTSSKS